MIAVRLEGRLGNQLFQYAFIYAAAKKLGVRFYLDQSVQSFLLDKYFAVEPPSFHWLQKRIFSIPGYKNLFSYYLKNKFYTMLKRFHGLKTLNFSSTITPGEELEKLSDGALYDGFFQSLQYWETYTADIARLFTIQPRYKQQYDLIAKDLPIDKTIIVIHIRRGDYLNHNFNLPDSYYHNAIKAMKVTNPFYVFISDDTEYVKKEFEYLSNKYISENNEIVDLQLLQNADVCILSNSSFSWWGAWLNDKASKTVYAPKNWLGFREGTEYPAGIMNNLDYNFIDIAC